MDNQEPYLVLTGEYGMGKTLLCLRLIQVLNKKPKPPVEYIATPSEGYGGILRRIAFRSGISEIPDDISILQNMIYDYFRSNVETSRFYLIVDDAQELDLTTLTRLKQLSTFSHNGFFPVSIIFIAHPSFLEELKTPALSSLNQRIKRRYHLSRFSFEDTKNYIDFRLLKSGSSGLPEFSAEALEKIFSSSNGVPRLINNICDACLLMGASKKLTTIPLSVVTQAVAMVDGSLFATVPESRPDSGPGDEPEESVTIADPVQAETEIAPDPQLALMVNIEEGQSENIRDKVSGPEQKPRHILVLTVAVLLLLAAGTVFFQFFLKNVRTFAVFSPSPSAEKDPVVSKSPMPTEAGSHAAQPVPDNGPLQPDGSGREDLSIQLETGKQSPAELSPQAGQTGTPPEDTTAHLSKDIPGADVELSPKIESPGAEIMEPVYLPYSLRSSSYQQPFRAAQELSEIRQMGLMPYLVRVDLGDMGIWWRVYIGFYSTEEDARKLKAVYSLSQVTIQKTEYACQLGEFSTETEVSTLFERLKQIESFPYVIQRGKNRFLMYVGAYERKSEAESEHRNLLKKGFKNQIVKR
jgi:type II secretory pathway predicted ATPase ExeA